jgi:hypothetical protein
MLHMRHVAEHGEDDETSQKAGKTVDATGNNRIPVGQNSLHYILSQHYIRVRVRIKSQSYFTVGGIPPISSSCQAP